MKKVLFYVSLLLVAMPAWAQRLPETAIPIHYQLSFTPDLQAATFEGTETIDLELKENTASITLNAVDINFKKIELTSAGATVPGKAETDPKSEMATLTFEKPVKAGAAKLHIEFTGTLNDQLRGFYLSKTEKRNYAVTQFEPTDARQAFPSFDEPAMKATFDITLVIDKGDTAISNGRIIKDEPGPGANKHTLTFSTTPKMSTYLVAMAIGDFKCIEGGADKVPIRICDIPGREKLLGFALESAEANLKYFDQYYAIKYPYGKLDVIAFPDFSAGAMENTAAITYREVLLTIDDDRDSVRRHKLVADVMSHEMAHQWFGDLVTAKWWDDIWLNEGFASWMSPKPLRAWKPEWHVEMDEVNDSAMAMNTDSLQSTRPIHSPASSTAEISQQFDAIAYSKGAAVLRMLEGYLGEQTFRAGVNLYLKEHAYGNATSEDFWNALSRVSNKPVDKVMASFVVQPGVPVVSVKSRCEGGNTQVTLTQERFAYDPAVAQAAKNTLWQIPVCLKTPGKAATCELITQRQQSLTLKGCAPYVYGNAEGRGYYRTSYDSVSLHKMVGTLESDLSGPERVQLVNDSWAMVRSGRGSIADYLAVVQGLQAERSNAVMAAVSGELRYISDYLVTDADRAQYEGWVRNLLHPVAEELGYRTASNDSDETKELRATVLSILGDSGHDPKVLATAREMTLQALEGSDSVDPSLFGVMVGLAAMHGDAALYDRIMAKLNSKNLPPEEFYSWAYALTAFRDPQLLKRTLEYISGPKVRNQDTAGMLGAVWRNPAGKKVGWEFFKANFPRLKTKLATYSYGEMAGQSGTFCDVDTRKDVAQFFSETAPQAKRSLNRALERIDNCIRLRQQQEPDLAAWLKRNSGGTSGQ